MFNFVSKAINTIGDLISVEEPPKQPNQPSQQPLFQRRFSGDARFFQKPARFQGPSQDDNLRIGPSSGTSIRPSSTPVYRYPTHSTTASYRPERYEESKFKAPDIDYNEDGYNVGRNYNGSERQSYITDIQKEYGMYREHDVDDANDYEEEDRYSLNYDAETSRRRRSSSSDRDNSQLKTTEEYSENVIYPDSERNYYTRENQHSGFHDSSYSDLQTFSNDTYSTNTHSNGNELAQFPSTSNAAATWIAEEEEYHKSRRRRKSDADREKGFRLGENDEKISPSPPSQEEDARNESRSESESSDEISFGEALATGLIPPHITPEIAARMNIELINHPKAVIESFYGHSPGEVYTIPEEEDEICSPTGADGVTSLRKQRMASARVEISSSDLKELQNQRRLSSANPQSEIRLKQKYGGQSFETKSEVERQMILDEMKENRPMVPEFTSQDSHKQFNPTQKFQTDNAKQPFRYTQPLQSENAQQFNMYRTDKPVQQLQPQQQQTIQPLQPQQQQMQSLQQQHVQPLQQQHVQPLQQQHVQPLQQQHVQPLQQQQQLHQQQQQQQLQQQQQQPVKVLKTENRPQPYQPDDRSQLYQPDNLPQMYQPDGRPQVYQFENRSQGYQQTSFQPDSRSQVYQGTQSYQTEGKVQGLRSDRSQVGPAEVKPQNYQPESVQQSYPVDNRSQQVYQVDNKQQGYQLDGRPQTFQQDNRAQGYPTDNRSQQNYPVDNRPQGYQPDIRPQGYQGQDNRSQVYQAEQQVPGHPGDNRLQGHQGDIRPQGYQPQPYKADIRPQGYQSDIRCQGYQPDIRPQGQQSDNRPQVYQPQGYQQMNTRPQNYPSEKRPSGQGYPPETRPPDTRPQAYQQQSYGPDNRSQQYTGDNRAPNFQDGRPQAYPPDNRQGQGYPQSNRSQPYPNDGRPQPYQADDRVQPYPSDNRQKVQETRRLPQPQTQQQYEDTQRQCTNQNLPQPYRESDNRYPQFPHPQDDRRASDHEHRRQHDDQDIDHQYSDQGQSNRRRLPLRKYNSEERYGSFEQDYEQRRGSQSHESPGRMQHDESYDSQGRPIRSRYPERLKHRSSSLEHDRNDQYYSRSRSSSFERSHRNDYADDSTDYDQYPNREHRRASLEHKKVLPRIGSQDQDRLKQKSSQQSRNPTRPSASTPEKTRLTKQSSWNEDHSRSRVPADPRKGENFCPQHKKFTTSSSTSTVAKPGRRVLPKEPCSQAHRKNAKRTQTQDKSTITGKSEDSSHQRTGILSNAARKTERSGHLKITFSDPISNLLNPNKKNNPGTNTASGHSRADASAKITSMKSDKPVITSNILPQSKNYIYPLPAIKTPNPPDLSHSPVPGSTSPLYRNQPSLDTTFRDNRLSMAANTRSLPIPIANRTCSLDRYSSSETNLNASPYYHDQFSRPGSAPGLMYEPVHQPSNQGFPMSLYEMHALKKEEKFWSDIYSALPADMKHLITNRGVGSMTRKLSGSNASFSSVVSSPATVIGGGHPAERASMENRMMQQRTMISKTAPKPPTGPAGRDTMNSSLGERIGNRLRMLHEMKEQAGGMANRRKMPDSLSRRSASDGEYSFSSTTNFPLCWNLARRPHSDSAIDLLDRLEVQNSPTRVSGSAYNSSEYLTKVVDKSQSYLASPCTNVPPSPAPTQPIRMLRDTALRGDHTESLQVNNYLPMSDNRSGFFSCLQNIESLTRQYEEEDRMRNELESGYDDEIYSEPGIPDTEYGRYHDMSRRTHFGHPARRRNDQF